MSQPSTSRILETAQDARKHKHLLQALKSQYKRIDGAGLPSEPYIVYVDDPPRPYHCRPDMSNTPFAPDEWYMQYQTLHYREFPDSILRLRAALEPDVGAQYPNPLKRSMTEMGGAHSGEQPVKKKISLSDYKSRAKSKTQPSTPSLAAGSNAHERSLKTANWNAAQEASDTDHGSHGTSEHSHHLEQEHHMKKTEKLSRGSHGYIDPGVHLSPAGPGSSKMDKTRHDTLLDDLPGSPVSVKKDSPLKDSVVDAENKAVHSGSTLGNMKERDIRSGEVDPTKFCADSAISGVGALPQIRVSSVPENIPELMEKTSIESSVLRGASPALPTLQYIPPPPPSIISLPTFALSEVRRSPSLSSPHTVGPYQLSETTGSSGKSMSEPPSPDSAPQLANHQWVRALGDAGPTVKQDHGSAKGPPLEQGAVNPVSNVSATSKSRRSTSTLAPNASALTKRLQDHSSSRASDAKPRQKDASQLKPSLMKERKITAAPSSFFAAMAGSYRNAPSRPATPASVTNVKPTATLSPEESTIVKLKYGKAQSSRVLQLLKLPQPRSKSATPAPKQEGSSSKASLHPSNASASNKLPVANQLATPQSHRGSPVASCGAATSAASSQPLRDIRVASLLPDDWKDEFKRQSVIGRQLKREMQATSKIQGVENQKLAAVIGIESVLCWIQAFAAFDQSQPNASIRVQNWESTVPLAREVAQNCHGLSHLFGFALFLRSTIDSIISNTSSQIERLDEKQTSVWREACNRLYRNTEQSNEHLSLDTLASQYPRAAKESRQIALGGTAAPMIAARVGREFLAEWSKKQGVRWAPKIEEGICSKL